MGDLYDPNNESIYLQYLDANNLYGWAMSRPLPASGFKWVNMKPNEMNELANRVNKGYLLDVNIRYPEELHDSHNDLPFRCQRTKINRVEKLTPILYNK